MSHIGAALFADALFTDSLLTGALLVCGAFLCVWLVSVRMRDTGVIDALWGPAFSIVPLTVLALQGQPTPRQLLVVTLSLAWGLRLAAHLLWRNHGEPEDRRYAAMRSEHGERWPLRSLLTVFALQATLVLVIGSPLHAAMHPEAPRSIGWVDVLATAIVITGILFEALADAQLTRFKADANNRGRVLGTGLWRYSRHPNYFGDALVWCGFGVLGATSVDGAWMAASVLGPALMIFLLLRVSGVTLLEKTIQQRRPEYDRYVKQTSAFIPWPRRAVPTSDGTSERSG